MARKNRVLVAVACALVAVAALPWSSAEAAPTPWPTVSGSIDWGDVRQPIDGFGASDAFNQGGELMAYPEPLRSQLLDALFSPTTGAGLSIVRHEVPNLGGPPGFTCKDAEQIVADPSCYRTDRDPGAVWFNGEAKARGASYTFGTVWSPPSWMKDNNNVNEGGHVRPQMYPFYADYLVQYVKRYKTERGVTIDGVSLANEPNARTNYPSAEWTGAEMHTFLRDHLKPKMAEEGVDFDVIMPEVSGWSDYMARESLADPETAEMIDVVAAHGYHYVTSPSPLPAAQDAGKRVWQTEMSDFCECIEDTIGNGLKWGGIIHEFMTRAETSAWLYWWAVSVVGDGTSQQTLINLKKSDQTATVNKRLWVLGNWSRFVRPGWERIGVRTDQLGQHRPNAKLSAYRDPATGKYVVVAINDSARPQPISLALNGFTSGSVSAWRTSATEELEPVAGTPATVAGGSMTAELAPSSITTFVADGTPTTDLRVAAADRVVASPGTSVEVPVTVATTGAGAPARTAPLTASVPAPLVATPASQDVAVPAGSAADASVTVTVPDGTAPGFYPLTVRTGDGAAAVGDVTTVKVVGDTIEFAPNTAEEAFWLAEPGSSQLAGALPGGGNVRFADGHGSYDQFPIYFVYGFDLPADVTGGTISVEMANQFKVSASTDGRTFTEVLREQAPVKDGSNKRFYDFDIADLADGGNRVFLRFEDASNVDGWGVQVSRVRASLERSGPTAVVPDAPFAALLPLSAFGLGLGLVARRQRRRTAA